MALVAIVVVARYSPDQYGVMGRGELILAPLATLIPARVAKAYWDGSAVSFFWDVLRESLTMPCFFPRVYPGISLDFLTHRFLVMVYRTD